MAKYTDRGRRYDVRMRLPRAAAAPPDSLDAAVRCAGDNRLVPLSSDVVAARHVSTLPVINRYNHQRKIEITANPAPGVSQGEAIATLPGDRRARCCRRRRVTVVELGNAQAMRETIDSLVFALVLGIVIAYMILGVQFNSFIHPLTVLLAMPFAVTGALVTLWLTGDTLNMMSMIGLILLMGLVKKNSIILVDYTNQLRDEGMGADGGGAGGVPGAAAADPDDVGGDGGRGDPGGAGLGPGAETRAPMARGIIGGIVLSTLVTLVLVPVFYVLMERLRAASGQAAAGAA